MSQYEDKKRRYKAYRKAMLQKSKEEDLERYRRKLDLDRYRRELDLKYPTDKADNTIMGIGGAAMGSALFSALRNVFFGTTYTNADHAIMAGSVAIAAGAGYIVDRMDNDYNRAKKDRLIKKYKRDHGIK